MRIFSPIVLISLLLLLWAKPSPAAVDFYYLKLSRNGKSFELGKTFDAQAKKQTFYTGESMESMRQKLVQTGLTSQRVWVYFHCMWGQNRLFHRVTLAHIREIVNNEKPSIVLSVLWPANQPGYRQNWKKANRKGQRLAGFFTCLNTQNPEPLNIISHSMGNRVFQGLWVKTGGKLSLNKVILAAPDLDGDIFSHDFATLPAGSQRIVIVKHDNDRLLTASRVLLGRRRLGRNTRINPLPSNLVVVDATPHASLRRIDMSNHMHFIFSDSVRHQLHKLAD